MSRTNLARYRMQRAKEILVEAEDSLNQNHYKLYQHIIKPDLFPKELSKFLPKAKDISENADYGDFVTITKEDAQTQLERAREFVQEAEKTMLKLIEQDKSD